VRLRQLSLFSLVGGAALALAGVDVKDAAACGCFVPPDPSVPIVQAGERIAFAMQDGNVTAHVQIQYAGAASDFGWLLPLPSVPTLELGTDELFTQLTSTTQPKYKLNRVYEGNCSFDPSKFGGRNFGAPQASATGGDTTAPPAEPSPLVIQDSIGPYDYAVLKADSKDDMLKWLADNRYFVPAGTDSAVGPYIHPGAFFLALKLKSGNQAGDIQPVVLHYKSDLPMIPLVLTSVAAQPNMGIQVWMLGAGRAIPRNYYHTIINDAKLDWVNGSANYNDVIIAATKEAPEHHSFVTEYAGTTQPMQHILNSPGRFGTQSELAAQPDEIAFVQYLTSHGFIFNAQLVAVLGKYIPVPPNVSQNCYSGPGSGNSSTAQCFYQNISYYLGSYRQQHPADFANYTVNYQPAMMAQDIQDRVVTPILTAGALFDQYPQMTRLYTTLDPEDMNKDPVFSFNPGLPSYPNEHDGTLTYHCGYFGGGTVSNTPATLRTASGWIVEYPYGTGTGSGSSFNAPAGPSSQRIEVLAEQGDPQVVVDNTGTIERTLPRASGCGVTVGAYAGKAQAGLFALLVLVGVLVRRVRRRMAA
jgi:MYXO-CTERM domain-containing protein